MSVHDESGRCVLVTGATGFLGGELLARMLRHERRSIVCLVRAAGDVEAGRRGRKALAQALTTQPAPGPAPGLLTPRHP